MSGDAPKNLPPLDDSSPLRAPARGGVGGEPLRESGQSCEASGGDNAPSAAARLADALPPNPPSAAPKGGGRASGGGSASQTFFLGAAVAASFLLSRLVEAPGLVEPIWKAAGIVLLGLAVALSGAFVGAAAFFASASGDFFLELKPQQMLIAGMMSFALAHVFFIAAFAGRMRKDGIRTKRWPVAALIAAFSAGSLFWMWSDLGDMQGPVAAYHFLLTAMTIAAVLAPVPAWAPAGAILFLLSDAVLGLGWFKGEEWLLPFNWPIYASGQALLALGLMGRNA